MPVRTNQLMILDDTIKTLSSDTLTVTQMYHAVAAESSTTDNLATITLDTSAFPTVDGANTFRPFVIIWADTGDTITVKHATGNIYLNSAADYALTGNKQLLLFFNGTNWTDLAATSTATGTIGGTTGATDNRLTRSDGTGGSTIQASTVTLDDTGNMSGVNTLGLVDATELTIASGAVTRTASYHRIDTEADAGSDDLDTISGGTAGQKLILRAENTARTVVVRHNGGGTGNIRTYDGNSITLDETYKAIEMIYDGTNWLVVGVTGSSGTGDVVGPGSSTDNAIARFDSTTGKLLQNSTVIVGDTGNISGINTVGLVDATELTIASGAITRTASYHRIDTEADAASDDLDTISGGTAGQVLYLRAENTARTVVLRHNGGGSGNIRTFDGNNISLTETYQVVELIYDGTNWLAGTAAFLSPSPQFFLNTAGCTAIAGTWTNAANTAEILNQLYSNLTTNAQNDEFEFKIPLAAGTYTLNLVSVRDGTSGILTVRVDGSTVGTIDLYNAGSQVNVVSSIASIVVAATATKTINFKLETKNASSTDYVAYLTFVQFIKTA
jgi:hypothetical protein